MYSIFALIAAFVLCIGTSVASVESDTATVGLATADRISTLSDFDIANGAEKFPNFLTDLDKCFP